LTACCQKDWWESNDAGQLSKIVVWLTLIFVFNLDMIRIMIRIRLTFDNSLKHTCDQYHITLDLINSYFKIVLIEIVEYWLKEQILSPSSNQFVYFIISLLNHSERYNTIQCNIRLIANLTEYTQVVPLVKNYWWSLCRTILVYAVLVIGCVPNNFLRAPLISDRSSTHRMTR